MPRRSSDDFDEHHSPEHSETKDEKEPDETSDSPEKAVRDACEELEDRELDEQQLEEVVNDVDEERARIEETNERVREVVQELEGFEEDLDCSLEEAREQLHEEFVNDMKSQLDGPSLKESKDGSSEIEHDSDTSEAQESSESYIEGGDGTVYAIETSEASESQAQSEVEETTESERQEASTSSEEVKEDEHIDEPEKIRNSIVRPEETEPQESEETTPQSEFNEKQERPEPHEQVTSEECIEDFLENESTAIENKRPEIERFPQPIEEETSEEEARLIEEITHEDSDDGSESIDIEDKPHTAEVETTSEDHIESEDAESGEAPDFEESDSEVDEVPEEIMEKIEEILDELDNFEDEEVDESRIIIDSMTGEQYIDHSLEPRPYFSETEEDREQEEDEHIRERLRELFAKLTEEEREKFKKSTRSEIESEEELERLVNRWRSKVTSPDFKQNLVDARQYVRNKRKGDVPRLIRELQALEVERKWMRTIGAVVQRKMMKQLTSTTMSSETMRTSRTKDKTRKRIFSSHKQFTQFPKKNYIHRPEQQLDYKKSKRIEKKHDHTIKWKTNSKTGTNIEYPTSLKEFNKLLKSHSYLRDGLSSQKRYNDVVGFYKLQELLRKNPRIDSREASRILELPYGTVHKWRKKMRTPQLIRQVIRSERRRLFREQNQESLRIDSTLLYNYIRKMKSITAVELVRILADLVQQHRATSRVLYLDLVHYSKPSPKIFAEIRRLVKNNQSEIKSGLSKEMESKQSSKVKFAWVKNRLYIWFQQPRDISYLNILSSELFYFSKKNWKRLINESLKKLDLRGRIYLSSLVQQLTSFKDKHNVTDGDRNSDIYSEKYLAAETLEFFIDTLNISHSKAIKHVKQIGYGKQITNPIYIEKEQLHEILARLYAIVASDGTIEKDYSVKYYEYNESRIERVVSLLNSMGIKNLTKLRKPNSGLRLPSVIGRVLHKIGMPIGDKTLQGVNFPDFILNGSIKVKKAYLEELLPEDGSFSTTRRKHASISVERTTSVYEPRRSVKGRHGNKIGTDMIHFIIKHGTTARGGFSRGDSFYTNLRIGKMKRIAESSDFRESDLALQLLDTIMHKKPELIIGEEKVCNALGISTCLHHVMTSYSHKTGRVTSKWVLTIRKRDSVIRWLLLAPPNDVVKRERTTEWMKEHKEEVADIRSQLEKEGLL